MRQSSGRSATESNKKKRRPPKRRRRRTGKPCLASHLAVLEESLTLATREAYSEMFGSPSRRVRPVSLDLTVSIDPRDSWRLEANPPIEEQIRTAVREMATQAEAFRGGSVHCYRCDRSDCPHSDPPRPSSVFGGYSSTGLPIWPELPQILLERKHPRVDVLYDAFENHLVAMYMDAESLKQRQLNVFGRQSKTYDVLGQVVFGFLKIRSPVGNRREPERVAFTLQAVEFRRLDGVPRLELNVLARLSDGSSALDAIKGPYQTRVSDVIASARHRMSSLRPPSKASIRRRGRNELPDTPTLVAKILQDLARKLEKLGRQGGRRTAHAEGHPAKNRPTSKAWEDAFAAPQDMILWDKHEETFVVLGPRSRVHVFSPEGRHVTSLVLAAEAVRSRRRRKRWVPLNDDQKERFGSSIGLLTPTPSKQPG